MNTPDVALHGVLPSLDDPVLVVHLHGWIDASGAAAAAMSVLVAATGATPIATFDSDLFIDYRARRPTMELRDGVSTRLVWPEIRLLAGADATGRPVLLLTGPEPDSQWQRFARAVVALARQLGVQRMAALGAYPFAAPHTRPARLSITTPLADVAATTPWLRSTLDVPAGAASLLEHALAEEGVRTMGIWAQVPHYVSAMPFPASAAALLDGLHSVFGIAAPLAELQREAEAQRVRIDQLVDGNDEHLTMVRQLEVAYDAEPPTSSSDGPLPTADEIAAEFERFLRDQAD